MLVKVVYDQKIYWLDPTRLYQLGSLDSIFQPNYDWALVVQEGVKELEPMNDLPESSGMVLHDFYDLTQGVGKEVKLKTSATYFGYKAERQRHRVAQEGLAGLQKSYLQYYKGLYSDAQIIESLNSQEDQTAGTLILEEQYLLDGFWELDEENNEFNATFVADIIGTYISKPQDISRTGPFALSYPFKFKHQIDARFGDENWDFENESFSEDNQFFSYHRQANFNKDQNTLKIIYDFKIKSKSVPADNIGEYMEARKKVLNDLKYSIYMPLSANEIKPTQPSEDSDSDIVGLVSVLILCFYVLSVLICFVLLSATLKKRPHSTLIPFYPVSLLKLYLLSVATFGLYENYWFYRNWSYLKLKEKSAMMPFWRAVFCPLWYYPFYKHLLADSQQRYQKNHVLAPIFAVLFAVVYFLVLFVSYSDVFFTVSVFVSPMLLMPLANYINHISFENSNVVKDSHRFYFRHLFVLVVFSPLVLYSIGVDTNVLPSNKVISGERIWHHDLKYIYRKKVIPADERIKLFYSSSFLSARADGNGFTQNYVFSYWKDEEGFHHESEHLANVQNIKAEYSDTWAEDTVVTIVGQDGREFILYLSNENGDDKKFVRALKNRWQIVRNLSGLK